MKLDEINNKTNEAVSYLVKALEAGDSEVLTEYLNAMARFHNYSFGNIMLIALQKPTATRVAGIRTWNSLGRFVKRGEKGIVILAPMVGSPDLLLGLGSQLHSACFQRFGGRVNVITAEGDWLESSYSVLKTRRTEKRNATLSPGNQQFDPALLAVAKILIGCNLEAQSLRIKRQCSLLVPDRNCDNVDSTNHFEQSSELSNSQNNASSPIVQCPRDCYINHRYRCLHLTIMSSTA